jgi:uncharacterized protein YndB with AHSA1/START domain
MSEATGAQVEVVLVADQEPEVIWDLITDVSRIGEWSPECIGARWLEAAAPRPGARFEGRNDFGGGPNPPVTCVVTQAQRPDVFEWIVLDPTGSVASPGSIWRYELTPGGAPGQTTVLHRFTHGPGLTGLSRGMQEDPASAEQILQDRLDTLRKHMTITLTAMAGSRPAGAGSDGAGSDGAGSDGAE